MSRVGRTGADGVGTVCGIRLAHNGPPSAVWPDRRAVRLGSRFVPGHRYV